MDFIETNWLLILLGLAVAIAIAWYVFHAARRTRVVSERRDVLDDGAAPAARNQALIDAPGAAGAGIAAAPSTASPAPGVAASAAGAAADRPPPPGEADRAAEDLTRIKGIGPRLVAQLHELGVTRLGEIAAWSEDDIDRFDARLGRFQGRIRRDGWVEQARLLASGDETAFASRFGRIP